MRTPSHNNRYSTDFFEEIPAGDPPADDNQPGGAENQDPNVREDAPPDGQKPDGETPAPEDQQIPKARFDKVYAESKESQRKLEEMQTELEGLKQKNQPAPPTEEDVALEAEAETAIKQLLRREGYADTKEAIASIREEMQQERANIALRNDSAELTSWAKEQGYPQFDLEKVGEFAKENNIAISSKSALKSAYLAQNLDAITAAAAKRGASSSETPKATVEKPGGGTGKAPSAPSKGPKTIQERIREASASIGFGQ